ncbi:Glyoxalase-like domain protein [Streptomyces sp. YIM 130001]|uniref:VOC family protein n=1 Tax=Streptomyces sp. YIM 130001 TaxID=2259644 RepID=UPI000E64ED41|nr:VOC family protein [Streptomyces sp. YIM 130001]RII19625.1 Glyoxalase-like domain protein [Streptomyces sp. YIM 130001]
MKLEFMFIPTSDLAASLALYRDSLGFTEMWREGEATVALALPGSDVQVMLDANDPEAAVGPLFVVDSVETFHAARAEALVVVEGPSEIPGGFLATYQDPGGTTIYVMDQSTDQNAS